MDIYSIQQALSEVHLEAPTTGVIIAAVLAAILLLLSGFASGSEIAFFGLSPQDLNALDPERNSKDAKIQMLREDNERSHDSHHQQFRERDDYHAVQLCFCESRGFRNG